MKTLIYLFAYIFSIVTTLAQIPINSLNLKTESTNEAVLDFYKAVLIQPNVYRIPIMVYSTQTLLSVDVELDFNKSMVSTVKAIKNQNQTPYLMASNIIINKLLVACSFNDSLIKAKEVLYIDFYTSNFDSINVSYLKILLNGNPSTSIVLKPTPLQCKSIKFVSSGSDDSFKSMNVYPNPSQSGVFHLDLNNLVSEDGSVEVMDLFGRNIYKSSTSNTNHLTIDISNVESGTYILKVKSGDSVKVKSLIVEK